MASRLQVMLGDVAVGGGAPIVIQSMTNTRTHDVEATLAQVRALATAGAAVVRVAVPDTAAAEALPSLVCGSPVPLVADIHFDHRLAVAAIEAGVAGIRINPGNIGGRDAVREVVDAAKEHDTVIRVGVNSGSLQRDLQGHGAARPRWSAGGVGGALLRASRGAGVHSDQGVGQVVVAARDHRRQPAARRRGCPIRCTWA